MLKSVLVASVCGLLISAGPIAKTKTSLPLAGDYVEARTASVFCGACHFNGEYMSTGNDAVAAWHFTSGSWRGVDVSGVSMMAAVTSDTNLAEDAAKKCELTISDAATPAQRQAALSIFHEKYAAAFGTITGVNYAPITFKHTGSEYNVAATGFASMSVQYMPNDDCCKQPNMVWYSPLVELKGRKVGYTVSAEYAAGHIGDTWQRLGENSAFYGPLAF